MKRIVSLFLFAFFSFSLFAQSNYTEAIQQGDDAFRQEKYTTAIRKYLVARAFDASKREEVQKKLDTVYQEIEAKQQQLLQAKNSLKILQKNLADTISVLSATRANLTLTIDTLKNVREISDDYKQKWENQKQELVNTISALSTTKQNLELITKERDECIKELEVIKDKLPDSQIEKNNSTDSINEKNNE